MQYLAPVLGRSNLTVLTDAKTLKVETEKIGTTTVTRGVTFQVKGQDGNKYSGMQCTSCRECAITDCLNVMCVLCYSAMWHFITVSVSCSSLLLSKLVISMGLLRKFCNAKLRT